MEKEGITGMAKGQTRRWQTVQAWKRDVIAI